MNKFQTINKSEIELIIEEIYERLKKLIELTKNQDVDKKISLSNLDIVRTADDLRDTEYTFVKHERIKNNLCYANEYLDFSNWFYKYFNIFGPVESYFFKLLIILIGYMVEALLKDFYEQKGQKTPDGLGKKIDKLKKYKIPKTIKAELHKLRETRNKIHPENVNFLENLAYKEEYTKFIETYNALKNWIKDELDSDIPF